MNPESRAGLWGVQNIGGVMLYRLSMCYAAIVKMPKQVDSFVVFTTAEERQIFTDEMVNFFGECHVIWCDCEPNKPEGWLARQIAQKKSLLGVTE